MVELSYLARAPSSDRLEIANNALFFLTNRDPELGENGVVVLSCLNDGLSIWNVTGGTAASRSTCASGSLVARFGTFWVRPRQSDWGAFAVDDVGDEGHGGQVYKKAASDRIVRWAH